MTIQEIHRLALEMGLKSDFRSRSQIEKVLKRKRERYEKLSKEEKELFDKDQLENPYLDSRIHFDSGVKKIKRILAGVDIDSAELMVARYLSNHNPKEPIDAVLAHHPVGKGLAALDDVMNLQVDVMAKYGVPVNIAESLIKVRISEVSRGVNPANHFQAVQTAELLGMSFLNVHTPCDNLVAKFVDEKLKKDRPEYVGEVLKSLLEIPEYREAAKQGIGPRLFTGTEDNRAGKIALTELTGGTEGSAKIYERLAQAGVGTIIGMHLSEEHRKEAEKAHLNVVIAGHISSDSIGMNLFLDELEKKGIEIVPCSGLIRVSRAKRTK